MTVAPLPLLNELFISDSKRIAILEKENEKIIESFKCPTYRSALEFNTCKIDPMICDCNAADHNVACLCNELLDLDQIFPNKLTLPFEHNAILLNVEKGTITAAPDFSAVQIHTQIKGNTGTTFWML
ncbi:unnamed protein product [Meloidogyne enterolobii]|uniref:Uncharacterized protein n=1 Tax=Meloidogyne enterolobii TaxID=390850 RepID=A0ACB0ZNV5_MELEN